MTCSDFRAPNRSGQEDEHHNLSAIGTELQAFAVDNHQVTLRRGIGGPYAAATEPWGAAARLKHNAPGARIDHAANRTPCSSSRAFVQERLVSVGQVADRVQVRSRSAFP
jgi:hypothetical protein